MPNYYRLLIGAASLLATAPAHAQQGWQPFRPGLTYQLSEHATPGDTTHTLRLAAGTPIAGTPDSLFRFTPRVGRTSSTGPAGCYTLRQALLPDNLFGATLRSQPHAVYVLAAANGRTLTLRPLAALGQSWATGLAGLTARVGSRSVAPVLGTTPDSVVTIQLSDGQVLRLSKSHGLLEGPSLDSYLNGRNRRRQLTLTALPERQLGTAVTGARAIYDYQPGDVFQSITTDEVYSGTCQKTWQQDSVLTRSASRTGDTLTFTLNTRRIVRGYGIVSSPLNPCNSPNTTTYSSVSRTLVVSSRTAPTVLTSFFTSASAGSGSNQRTSAAFTTSTRVGGRFEYTSEIKVACQYASPDSIGLGFIIDFSSLVRYGVGIGTTYSAYSSMANYTLTNLTAYHKSTQNWGTFFSFKALLLAARPTQPATTTTAFPSPFGASLTAAFVLGSAQAVGLSLHDALGREVRAVPAQRLASGPQQLAVPTAGLPAGLYTLHLALAGEARTEVLKVVKTD